MTDIARRLDLALGADDPALAEVSWSASVVDAGSGAVLWSHTPDVVLRTASIGKIFLLVEVARLIEAGELDLSERVTRLPEEILADSGIWHVLAEDTLRIGDACALIGMVSDNVATNVLVRRLGIDRIRETTRALGVAESALLDRVREERLPEHPVALSVGRADELADVAARLHRGAIVSPGVSSRVTDWLKLNTDLSMTAQAFGLDPLAHADVDRGIRLWNKTGTVSTVRVDVGAAEGPSGRAIAWAVGANWASDGDPRDAVLARMGAVGRVVRAEVGAES
ncbi:serine hydrolase [Agromyces protaetiae]|uniref:Serine hydrolase n=1 Tax=Agromyces protaetiae TaxID=2509455 RepID=A0A4P6FCU8_9MICO|nr:serine hydrolase [Agromyces protaetiae]QAY73496.1 serine hydrolase [Agromyces protaetiae]